MSNQRPVTSSAEDDQLACFAYGVGHGAEGVCLLVQMGPYRILIDCGLEDISPLKAQANFPAPGFCQALPWRSPIEFREGLSVQLFPAGHLPGAAAFLLTYTSPNRTYRLLYTGDFFISNSRLVEGLSIEALRGTNLDVLIIEGSYGTARHPHRRQQENQLVERIDQTLAANRYLPWVWVKKS